MALTIDNDSLRLDCTIAEKRRLNDYSDRRMYLYGVINEYSIDDMGATSYASNTGEIVEQILDYNREDKSKSPSKRKPIRLYINSPGGDLNEGFALIDAIEISKTPVYTINVGQWSSMSFLIGITGHKRFSFPSATFLMHDGSTGAFDSTSKVQDRVEFEKRFKSQIVKQHVLKHSNMKGVDYDALERVEYYLLPTDALERGFIDEIVTDVNAIL